MEQEQTVYIPTQGDRFEYGGYTLADSEGEYMSNLIEKQGYFHTKEELIELFKGLLDKAAESAETDNEYNARRDEVYYSVKKESITDILPDYIKEIGL